MFSPVKWCMLIFLYKSAIASSLSGTCDEDSLYLIRSSASSFVLDGRNGIVTIQYFDGYTPQLWKFKKGNRPGMFYIENSAVGKVLDVDKANGNRVVLSPQNESLEQQWFLHYDGRIVNARMNKNLDVAWAKYVPDNPIYAVQDNRNAAQEFSVKEKMTCCSTACADLIPQNNTPKVN